MSAHPPRSLFSRFRSLTSRDGAAAPDPDATGPGQPGDAVPVWAVVASVAEPGAGDRPEELKGFAPGAMVYVLGPAGGGRESLSVVGRGRKGSRFVTATMAPEHLTGWRVEPVYSPTVLRRLGRGGGGRWPVNAADPSGDDYRLELLGLAAGLARRGTARSD
jgi:hypothetical protein